MLTSIDPQIFDRVGLTEAKLDSFCQKWGIESVALFGSVLRQDFNANSDIDLLVSFMPDAKQGLLTLVEMKFALEALLNRTADIVVRQSIEESENWIRKQEILSTAKLIYERD
ncbi:MAG: nucleotidyltransferase domain-containing protein [Cyanobacteria bacterium J06632_3]